MRDVDFIYKLYLLTDHGINQSFFLPSLRDAILVHIYTLLYSKLFKKDYAATE